VRFSLAHGEVRRSAISILVPGGCGWPGSWLPYARPTIM